ncbi:MAG TPA: nucleotidyltransferase [Clostridiales bacterium]|nr:nucleotidyltransferase [Clostridiales bacterium]
MNLVILAAGMGSRYGGLKQIDPVGKHGEFIIDYSIYDALKAGYKKIVFIILEENLELFRETIGKRLEKEAEVRYVFQGTEPPLPGLQKRKKPWGTAHALLAAESEVDGNFAVINADDFYGAQAYALVKDYMEDKRGGEYSMAGYVLENTLSENGHVARGVCEVDAEGFLTRIDERIQIQKNDGVPQYFENDAWFDLDPKSAVSMNFWGLTPQVFDEIKTYMPGYFESNMANIEKAEYYLPWLMGRVLSEGDRVKVLRTSAKWFGVTYPQDKEPVERRIAELTKEGVYPERLWHDG